MEEALASLKRYQGLSLKEFSKDLTYIWIKENSHIPFTSKTQNYFRQNLR